MDRKCKLREAVRIAVAASVPAHPRVKSHRVAITGLRDLPSPGGVWAGSWGATGTASGAAVGFSVWRAAATSGGSSGGAVRPQQAEMAMCDGGGWTKRSRPGPGPVQTRSMGDGDSWTERWAIGDGGGGWPEVCVRWRWRLVRCAMAAGPSGGSVRWRRLVRVFARVARPQVELWRRWPGPAAASDGGVQRRGWSEPAGPGHRR